MPFCYGFGVNVEDDNFYIFEVDEKKVLRLFLALRKRNIVNLLFLHGGLELECPRYLFVKRIFFSFFEMQS